MADLIGNKIIINDKRLGQLMRGAATKRVLRAAGESIAPQLQSKGTRQMELIGQGLPEGVYGGIESNTVTVNNSTRSDGRPWVKVKMKFSYREKRDGLKDKIVKDPYYEKIIDDVLSNNFGARRLK